MVPYGVHGNFTLKCRGTVENKECGWRIKKLWYYPYYKRNATPTPHEHILGSQRELQSPYLAAPTWGGGTNFGEDHDDHLTGWRRKKERRKEGRRKCDHIQGFNIYEIDFWRKRTAKKEETPKSISNN